MDGTIPLLNRTVCVLLHTTRMAPQNLEIREPATRVCSCLLWGQAGLGDGQV
jgi:hypothetical protein